MKLNSHIVAKSQNLRNSKMLNLKNCFVTLSLLSWIIGRCMCAKSLQFCRSLRPLPGSPGISRARILEWVATPSSGRSFQPRGWSCVFHLLHWPAGSLPLESPGKPYSEDGVASFIFDLSFWFDSLILSMFNIIFLFFF